MSKKNEPSNKTKTKQKEKVVEDLTFGLKNKNKSKVVQQYVKEVTNKVMFSNVKVSSTSFAAINLISNPFTRVFFECILNVLF
jgi:hypothetical protein